MLRHSAQEAAAPTLSSAPRVRSVWLETVGHSIVDRRKRRGARVAYHLARRFGARARRTGSALASDRRLARGRGNRRPTHRRARRRSSCCNAPSKWRAGASGVWGAARFIWRCLRSMASMVARAPSCAAPGAPTENGRAVRERRAVLRHRQSEHERRRCHARPPANGGSCATTKFAIIWRDGAPRRTAGTGLDRAHADFATRHDVLGLFFHDATPGERTPDAVEARTGRGFLLAFGRAVWSASGRTQTYGHDAAETFAGNRRRKRAAVFCMRSIKTRFSPSPPARFCRPSASIRPT